MTNRISVRAGQHPRLFFTAAELRVLRSKRDGGVHARVYANLKASADWCLTMPPRKKWIAPISPDPIYENLYERFYGMMRDMAIAEHLAFAYAYAPDGRDRERYFAAARRWAIALSKTWVREGDGEADGNKAYAVTRLLKGIAVAYDLLYARLSARDRDQLLRTMITIGRRYYEFFRDPKSGFGSGYEPHHGSVEVASFGLVALAIVRDAPEAKDWLELVVERQVNWLMPEALTRSGTHNQTSNFWISIMQYRVAFMDALRRVTGRDLFIECRKFMPTSVPLACAVWSDSAPGEGGYAQSNQTWLWGPSYGQIDYASPALVGLAREYRAPDLQSLALCDRALGAVQKSRYVTRGEQMLFSWGGYAYAWFDESAPASKVSRGRKRLSWLFEDPDPTPEIYMNEAYARSSFEPGALAVGVRRGAIVAHAGGRAVLVDFTPSWPPQPPVKNLSVRDNGRRAVIRCVGAKDSGFDKLTLTLIRPGRLIIEREGAGKWKWWSFPSPTKQGPGLAWPDGTRVKVTTGKLTRHRPRGYTEEKVVGMGKLVLVDPLPTTYPVTTIAPEKRRVVIEITSGKPPTTGG